LLKEEGIKERKKQGALYRSSKLDFDERRGCRAV
jgi:hypothetical protein